MKEIVINTKTQEKIKNHFHTIKQLESQIIMIVESYLDAINESGKWQLTEDFSKIMLEEEAQKDVVEEEIS
jgi:hypothetical protein